MSRKKSFVLVMLALLINSFIGHVALASEEGGPEINVSESEMNKEVTNEDGLKRLGNFGRLHLFGYGDAHYTSNIGATKNEVDVRSLTLGVGYDFTDRIQMRSEIDLEHGFKEPEIEFVYLDFLLKSWANIRAGAILVPMGVINEHHEPPLFLSVNRPEVYRLIIPTEWPGIGAGFYGQLPAGFSYELYGLSSLTAVSFKDDGTVDHSFTGSNGFDDAHSIAEGAGDNFVAAGRLEYKGVRGLRLATSFFLGNTGQGNSAIGSGFLTMLEGDAKYSFQGIDLEGLFAFTNLSDAGRINNVLLANDATFTDFAGRQMMGWYLEGAYHLFHHLMPNMKQDLVVFGRYENINTQHAMPAGFAADPANDRHSVTVGASFMPIPQVAIKADYVFNGNKANAGVDQFNIGLGFYY